MKQLLVLLLCLFILYRFSSAQTAVCKDSSTTTRYSNSLGRLEVRNQNATPGNGLITAGFIRNTADLSIKGFIAKLDADKNISWSKTIVPDNDTSSIELFDARECADGNTIAAGILTDDHTLYRSIMLYKFNNTGGLLWQKNIRTLTKSTGGLSFAVDGINEGKNKEVLLSSHHLAGTFGDSVYFSITKLTAAGDIVWNHTFSNSYTEPPGIFHANLSIFSGLHLIDDTLFCIGGPDPVIMKLNYNTGNFDTACTTSFTYKTSGTHVASEIYFTTALVDSKHFAFTCETNFFTPYNEMFSVVFDNILAATRSYRINALNMPYTPFSSVRKNILYTNTDTLLIGMPVDRDLYFSAIANTGKIIQERKLINADVSFGFVQKNLLNGNSDALAVMLSQNPDYLPNGFQVYQLQDYGKQFEDCIGVNDPHLTVEQINVVTKDFKIITDKGNKFMASTGFSILNDLGFVKETLCKSVSICDSIKIDGPSLVCSITDPVIFKVKRRSDCLKRISWDIDTAAISAIQNINDSTVAITFKKEWSGYVFASISACTVMKDSFKVEVHASPVAIDLGKDTSFCTLASTVLNAKKGFKNYTWQDGSVDSVFTASATGKYYVTAFNYCGKPSTDTINLFFFKKPVVDLGKDTSFCELQPITFTAGDGLKTYLWSTGSTTVSIKATHTGLYNVVVTDSNNCKATDTVEILEIYPSPKVSLDKNITLCLGQGNVLHAGKGFTTYLWQNGDNADTLTVSNIGKYWVQVINEFGCSNRDSIIIKQLHQSPAAFLFNDSTICVDAGITLKTVRPFSTYFWSNNATTPAIQISSPGKYWLQVKDYYGCAGKDTVEITNRNCPGIFYIPNAFTPNGDMHNDIFKPTIDGVIESYSFNIFNRWGQLLFTSFQINYGWDGNFKSIQQSAATYTWVCSYQLKNKKPQTVKGTVILLR